MSVWWWVTMCFTTVKTSSLVPGAKSSSHWGEGSTAVHAVFRFIQIISICLRINSATQWILIPRLMLSLSWNKQIYTIIQDFPQHLFFTLTCILEVIISQSVTKFLNHAFHLLLDDQQSVLIIRINHHVTDNQVMIIRSLIIGSLKGWGIVNVHYGHFTCLLTVSGLMMLRWYCQCCSEWSSKQ